MPLQLSTRPPLTPHEADVVRGFDQAIKASETFYTTGQLDIGVNNPVLMYLVDEVTPKALSLKNPTPTMLDDLHDHCAPSHFGHGKELVKDELYRLARELEAEKFGLNFDPIAQRTGVVATVSAFVKKGVDVRMYKLNSYTANGLFKAHQDTPKATNHIGTLLIGLPAPHTGGELVLRHAGESVTVDWNHAADLPFSSQFKWTFFYSDVEHEILPVTAGHRLTLAYDVCASESIEYKLPMEQQAGTVDFKSTRLYAKITAMLADPEFLPKGGEIGYRTGGITNDLDTSGSDNALWHTLAATGLHASTEAVYEPVDYDFEREDEDEDDAEGEETKEGLYESDQFSCLQSGSAWHGQVVIAITSNSFRGIDEKSILMYDEGDTKVKAYMESKSVQGRIDWDLIWVSYPKTYTRASAFAAYGNYPSTDYSYVAGAVIVQFPAAGEGARKQ